MPVFDGNGRSGNGVVVGFAVAGIRKEARMPEWITGRVVPRRKRGQNSPVHRTRRLQASPLSIHPNKRHCAGSFPNISARNVLVPLNQEGRAIIS